MTTPYQRALDGWRTTRSPRYAAVADALLPERELVGDGRTRADTTAWNALETAGDPSDTPRLIAAIAGVSSATAAAHVARIATRDDPHIAPGLFRLLENPPFTGDPSKAFWQALVDALAAARDPRVKPRMTALAKRYYAIVPTRVGTWIAERLEQAAGTLPSSRELAEDEVAPLEALEREVLGHVAAPELTAPSRTHSLDELFAQIVANPDDDGARLVYADALIESGQAARGELIVLQVARASGHGTLAQADRERVLDDSKLLAELAVPLSTACEAVTFERGFPVSVYLRAKGLAQVTDAVEWGTVRLLDGVERAPIKAMIELFASGRVKNVVELRDIPAARFAKLAPYGAAWTCVHAEADGLRDDALTQLPALTKLVLTGDKPITAKLLAGAPRIDDLALWGDDMKVTPTLLAALPALRRLTIRRAETSPHDELSARAFPVEWLKIYAPIEYAAAWLEAFPHVRSLNVFHDELLQTHGSFDWSVLRDLLATPHLTEVGLERFRGSTTVRLDRTADGWTLVVLCCDRWPGVYEDLRDLAPQYAMCGVTRVILEPSQARHYAEPFSDLRDITLDDIAQAWAPIPFETRDVLRWHGQAPDEGATYNRGRDYPVR